MPYITSWERLGEKRGVKIGEERGVKIGEERGVKIGKRETARKLIERGIDIDIIAEATGFSRKEIENLAETTH